MFATRLTELLACTFVLSSCAIKVQEPVTMPPRDLSAPILSINIQPFSSDQSVYGARLAEEIKTQLANESYVQVFSQSAEAVLNGTLTVGHVNYYEYTTSYQVERKDNNGRKYKTTEYVYNLEKSLPISVTYSVTKGEHILGGNTIDLPYKQAWSGGSVAEARARADSDEAILLDRISAFARTIVEGISPHKELWSFDLQGSDLFGGNDYLKAGIEYYRKGLYPQAEAYWQRVISESDEPMEKAAACYDMGVLKMHQGQYQEAFKMFREADQIDPANKVYMDALVKVERAGVGQQQLRSMGINLERH